MSVLSFPSQSYMHHITCIRTTSPPPRPAKRASFTNPPLPSYFAAYFIVVTTCFTITQKKTHLVRYVYWLYDNYPCLHRWAPTQGWGRALIGTMKRMKRQPVCILAKTDEVSAGVGFSRDCCVISWRVVEQGKGRC